LSVEAAIELLSEQAATLSMCFSDEELAQFTTYLNALAAYNANVNLVSDASPQLVVKRHILDCLAVVEVLARITGESDGGSVRDPEAERRTLIDVGSGAGLPGLIIAIACPALDVVLLDSIGKKTRFLQQSAKELGLDKRVSVLTGRAEELGRTERRGSFNFATSRAVGHLGLVAELTLPLLKSRGRLLCQKSRKQVGLEVKELAPSLEEMGGSKPEIIVPNLQTGETEHVVVSIEKRKGTRQTYPRAWAEIIRHWKGQV
jgi:16S rRNA (guanine527-N7)-methyltransferase